LLSKDYGRRRAALIDPARADPELRPGDPERGEPLLPAAKRLGGHAWGAGTVHVDAIDRRGTFCAFTPSGAWLKSQEVIPALGFPLGNRLMTFYLEPAHHPNRVAPFKRPRTTISPSLAFRRGEPWMAFGSMGGDMQDQWQLQFFLNRVVFGMTIQEAIEAPKFSSEHFPGFFAPHDFIKNRVRIEPRVAPAVRDELTRRGHDLEIAGDWTEGYLLAAERHENGLLEAGCDPRGGKSDVFPAFALCW
jgi:gamma-glutamyltranspeptidase/glutathione hydrolase